MKTATRLLPTLSFLALTGCKVLGFGGDVDEGNDTQIGDDDADAGTGETGDEGSEVAPIEDHGIADYCVTRAEWWNAGGFNTEQ